MIRLAIAGGLIASLERAASAESSAEQLFEQGQIAFEKGDYATAAAKWRSSYRLSKEPEMLFNIAQALRRDGRCADALATYRRFVKITPTSAQRPIADDLIRELEPQCGAEKQSDPPSEDGQPGTRSDLTQHVDTRPGGTTKTIGIVFVGAGVAALATGLYFGHRASSLGSEVSSACMVTNPCNWGMYKDKDAEGRSAETKQYVFVGVGAAAIIGGGVMYWWASRERRTARIAVVPGRDGAGITWSGSW